jgi:hypothetical protein
LYRYLNIEITLAEGIVGTGAANGFTVTAQFFDLLQLHHLKATTLTDKFQL